MFQIAFDHCQFVVTLGGLVANFYEAAKKLGGFGKTFCRDAEVCELDESIGEIGIGFEGLLKIVFRFGLIALAAFYVADVEEARRVVRVELEALFEILAGFVESA